MIQHLNSNLIIEIKKRVSKDIDWISSLDYHGLRMDKTHSQEEENKLITKHNEKVIDLFKDHLDSFIIKQSFDCWKGSCFFSIGKDYNTHIKEFSGWCSEDIIYWLIKYGEKEFWKKIEESILEETGECNQLIQKDIYRIITQKQRYKVLKRQKWRCNNCGESLKYNLNSKWKGETGHIDHIHPYSKRNTYPNGKENINELSNLQALCPKCNLKKSNKKVQ